MLNIILSIYVVYHFSINKSTIFFRLTRNNIILLSSTGKKRLNLKLSSDTYNFSNDIKTWRSPVKCAWWHMNLLLIMLSQLIMLSVEY